MDFKVRSELDFLHVKTGFRKTAQRIQRTSLQQFGQRAFQRDLESRMRAEAGKHALILRMQQRHVHHRITATQRGVAHQDAKTCRTQTLDAGSNARVTRDHFFRHLGQTQAFANDAIFDVALENFRQRLGARFHRRVAGRHAVADVQIADDVDWNPGFGTVVQAFVRQRADTPLHVAGIEIDQHFAIDVAVRVIKRVQFGIEQLLRPVAVFRRCKPALLRVMHVGRVGAGGSKMKMGPEIMRAQALEKFAQRAGAGGELGRAFAVGKQHRAFAVTYMDRPDRFDGIEPG